MTNPPIILGNAPADVDCPECHKNVRTIVIYRPDPPSFCASFFALLICCFCWPCICLPLCCHACLRSIHSCPNCNAEIRSQGQNSKPIRPNS